MRSVLGAVMGAFCLSVFLFSDPAFALRAKEGQVILDELDDYLLCQSKDYTGEWCHDALVRWVKDHPEDAFKAGKMTRRKMNAWSAIPFFAQAFDQKKADCQDEDVKLAVMSALGLPSGPDDQKILEPAKRIGLKICIDEYKDMIAKEASPGSALFKNSCKDLLRKGALAGLKKKKCEEGKQ